MNSQNPTSNDQLEREIAKRELYRKVRSAEKSERQVRLLDTVRREEDVAEVADHLRSTTLGIYHRNHCLIRLKQDYSFWNPENEPTLGRLSVFVHEYFHFIHNFSTIVGLYDFVVQLRLLRPFCNTVGFDGRSVGSSVLGSEARNEIRGLLTWRNHLRGGARRQIADALKRSPAHPSFVGFRHVTRRVRLAAQEIDCRSVLVAFDGAALGMDSPSVEVVLGSEILMEGCAVEAECMLFARNGVSADEVLRVIPAYPYRTARTIFEGIVGASPSNRFLCSICLLALHSTDPGDAFIEIAYSCKSGGKEIDEDALLQRFKANSDEFITNSVRKILTQTLPLEIAPFTERGHAGRGLAWMLEWCNTLFEERLKDSWFEIAALDSAPDLVPLVELLRTMPVCPVIQEVNPSGNREELLFFSEVEIPREFVDEIGAAQSLLHFSAAHLTTDGDILSTSSTYPRECFFVNVCQAPLAIERSPICQRSPWESFDSNGRRGCWYAQGVSAARGRRDEE
ncbi:hypothetical protein J2778_002107 [Paraburkholderia graminis]|uniref:hypothetical protein n=1 Tax=Paraburkholderia graminis TaxID=60548 RepID=UPI00285D1D26|nr:hypothetical protein [Paraburkholderia graminis]MDR6474613.1 hypothetical protein [Paraburkholderia graminis]